MPQEVAFLQCGSRAPASRRVPPVPKVGLWKAARPMAVTMKGEEVKPGLGWKR